ncbi:MAG: glycosyltransferase [Bacilli bacterium]|nr:glycosyltransferase [Bacilli bacterium]
MKKIFIFVQQLSKPGGSETVEVLLANEFSKQYKTYLVVTGEPLNKDVFDVTKDVEIIYLNRPQNSQIDEKIVEFCRVKQKIKAFSLIIKNVHYALFGKFKIRKKIKELTTEEDVLIGSSLDNYLIIPRRRKFIMHYHFNEKKFNSFFESLTRCLFRKPDAYVFLNDEIKNSIIKKHKSIKKKSYAILNPIKVSRELILKENSNNLVFIGRFSKQKNLSLMIDSLNLLKEQNFNFRLDMYGDGPEKENIIKQVNDLNLNDFIFIHPSTNNVKEALENKDLLLLSSSFEGTPLVISEANSLSVPVFSTNFGSTTQSVITLQNGRIASKNDKETYAKELTELLSNKELVKSLRISSFESTEKYDIGEISKNWVEIFKKF